MTNLQNAKPNDIIKFRCGGEAEIESCYIFGDKEKCLVVHFKDHGNSNFPWFYKFNGSKGGGKASIFDITHLNGERL